MTTELERVAPRLARAHRQRRAELHALAAERRRLRRRLLELERLVAHRELQELRAGATRDRRYIARRAAKLASARRELAEAQARARELGLYEKESA